MTRPPDAVTFDYWNTLCFEPDMDQRREQVADAWLAILAGAGVEAAREALGEAYVTARDEYWKAWHENRQFTGTDAARLLLEHLDRDGSYSSLSDALIEAFHECSETAEVEAVDGVGAVLEALRSEGIRIGIVCDVGLMASPYLRRHLDRHGLLGYFDHWSFSDEVGVYKPDRRIFEHALAGLGGVAPDRSVHVGDRRRTDIAGAQGMGMGAFRFTGVYDDDDPEQGPSGDVVFSRYDEFLVAVSLG